MVFAAKEILPAIISPAWAITNRSVWPVSRVTSSASLVVYAYYHASKRHDDCPDDRRSDDGQLVCAAAHKALSLGSKIEHFRSYEVPDIPCCVTPQGT
jgi:hypothetical protein